MEQTVVRLNELLKILEGTWQHVRTQHEEAMLHKEVADKRYDASKEQYEKLRQNILSLRREIQIAEESIHNEKERCCKHRSAAFYDSIKKCQR